MLTNLKLVYTVTFSVEVWQIVLEFHEQFVSLPAYMSHIMSPNSSHNTRVSLSQVYFLYQSSMRFFVGVFQVVLSGNTNLKEMVEKLSIITYQVCMERVCVWCGMVSVYVQC